MVEEAAPGKAPAAVKRRTVRERGRAEPKYR
jgi:hypothetical protein